MSDARGRTWNRLLVVAAMALGLELRAAAPQSSVGAEGGISGAKRDYDAIKAPPVENGAERPKIHLPPGPTLELKTESAVPTTTVRGRKLTEEERLRELEREKNKSRDWLIEAMAKQEQPASAATTETATSTDANTTELDRAAKLMALLDAISAKPAGEHPTTDAAPAVDAKEAPAVLNPLDRYMASWMTVGDFKLLGPKPDPTGASGRAELFQPLTDAPDRTGAQPFMDLSVRPNRESTAAENPYLRDVAALAPGSINLAELAPPPAAVRPNLVPPLLAPLAPPEPPPPASFSEQLKAQDDAKYFKQLKRF